MTVLRRAAAAAQARLVCRRRGHHWTTMAEPPICLRCRRTGWAA